MLHRPARVAALLFLLSGAQLAWAQGLAPAARPRAPATIEAQSIEGVSEFEVTARGSVEFQREDLSVYAEFLRFNQEFGRIEADGGVRLQRGVDRFFGPRLRYNTRDDTGVFEEPTFLMGRVQVARGSAERLEFLGKDHLRLNRASFTTCEPGDKGWVIEAGELDLDYEEEVGTARDMRLRLLDTTIFSFPYATFPLEKRRKSGFLAPQYSQNTRRGLEIGIPYYWNIAPEQDLTVTPLFLSKRGEQLKSNYRYLSKDYAGQFRLEYMPNDDILKRPRSGYTLQHEQQFLPTVTGRLDLNKVSDDRYFVDLASHVRQISLGNVQREGLLTYNDSFYGMPTYLQGRVQRFQTLQDPLSPTLSPYHRVPQINFGTSKTEVAGLFDFTFPGEYVRFAHASLVEGARTSFNPQMSMPFLAPGYFVTPKIGMRHARYDLSRVGPAQPEHQTLNVPYGSVDGGLIFERGTNLFGENLTQTLEPRFFYVYAPYRAQDQIPLFDTTLADFNYAQLFTENRFAGGDRFGDANQVTVAVTSRLVGNGGQELFRATLGQRYHFKNERVGLTPTSPLRGRHQSDLLASIGGRFAQSWTFDNTIQYDPQNARVERAGASVRYAPEIAKVISASYRYNRDPVVPVRQVDLSAQWPVQPGWYAIGRVNYSFLDKRLLEGLAGLEYNAGCWVVRGVFQRVQAATQTSSTGVYFQIEFNGLGQIGSDDTVDFLRRNIPGYARTNPIDAKLVPQSMRPRLPFEQVF
ncbi:MAG: LPS-assembly protein LptD [Candidatus Parcubacteria bacterium]|nr:LPS-assembly protein LptD [Burkholderiales bacterium]